MPTPSNNCFPNLTFPSHLSYLLLFGLSCCLITCQSTPEEKPLPKKTKTPLTDWNQVVFYQVFPERFHNADTSNDPTFDEIAGGWPDRYFDEKLRETFRKNWQISPWTSDWYAFQPWESGVPWMELFGWAKPDDPLIKNYIGMRRYGGDLQGVIDKLDYLQDLGVTAIYLNPVFEAPSLHKYDTKYYHHVDNNFGPDKKADEKMWASENPADPSTWKWTTADKLFLSLIEKCHERGMRIIIDGVFNHTGTQFWAFNDIVNKQQKSAFTDWYDITKFDDPNTPENEFDYKGWIGIKDLPEFTEDENGLISGPKAHVKAIVQRWMDPNNDGDPSDGIDGWRLDVAEMVDIAFWRDFNDWVKKINPDAYITGEIWWHDYNQNEMFNASPWLKSTVFDGVMNYRFTRAVKQFVADQNAQVSATAFADSLKNIYQDYPWERVLTCQNLIDSHDLDRFSSQIVNPDRAIDHQSDPYSNKAYQVRKPHAEEWKKLKLAAALQFTLPGLPMVYYGTEAGMWGSDDPDQRKPMVWANETYDPETYDAYGKERPADTVAFNQDLFDYYQQLIKIRKTHSALVEGTIDFIVSPSDEVLIFKRTNRQKSVLIIINNQAQAVTIPISEEQFTGNNFVDLVSKHVFTRNKQSLELLLPAFGLCILSSQ